MTVSKTIAVLYATVRLDRPTHGHVPAASGGGVEVILEPFQAGLVGSNDYIVHGPLGTDVACNMRGVALKQIWTISYLKCTCTPKIFFDMWKGHNLEVHCTNNQRKGSSSNEIILYKVKQNNWVWENFREDYTTLALFAGIKGTILVTILIVSYQTLKFEMYYVIILDEYFSLNVGAMDFLTVSLSHIKKKMGTGTL